MCDLDEKQIDAMIEMLANWPANAKPPSGETRQLLQAVGFIEERDTKKPCRTCGHPQIDYTYFKITPAGKLFLAAARKGKTT